MTILKNLQIFDPDGPVRATVVLEAGRIRQVIRANADRTDGRRRPDRHARVIDCAGGRLLPGFVEIHTHGAAGIRGADADHAGLDRISRAYARHGATAFVVSVSACPAATMHRVIETVRQAQRRGLSGARLVGIHFEGPWLNPACAGGMAPGLLRRPRTAELNSLLGHGAEVIRIVTLAPELPGAFDAIRRLHRAGITVAAGHTRADARTIDRAIRCGLSLITHIFNNGEPPFTQVHGLFKDPGPLTAFLTRDELTAEVIADGVHVAPEFMRLLFRAKGATRVAVCTDSCPALDYGKRKFSFTELDGSIQKFEIKNNALYIGGTDRLTGSVLGMSRAFRNLQQFAGLTPYAAQYACSTLPARLLRLCDAGEIRAGWRADLVLLDRQGNVRFTMAGGNIIHQQET